MKTSSLALSISAMVALSAQSVAAQSTIQPLTLSEWDLPPESVAHAVMLPEMLDQIEAAILLYDALRRTKNQPTRIDRIYQTVLQGDDTPMFPAHSTRDHGLSGAGESAVPALVLD